MRRILFGASRQGWLTDLVLFFLRAFTGLSLGLGHGAAKIVSGAEYEAMLAEWGVPGPGGWAWISAVAETLGGFFLAAGLLTRIASLFVAGNMAFLLMVQYGGDLFGRGEVATIYLTTALVFLVLGSGRFSLDAIFRRRRRR